MHRFNMGNDNPIRNEKLLREAYQAGRQQALNEQGMGGDRRATQRLRRRMMGEQFGGGGTPPTFQQAPMNPMAYGTGETRDGNRMGMGMRGKDDPFDLPRESPKEIPSWIRDMLPNNGSGYGVTDTNPPYIVNPSGVPVFYYDGKTGRWQPVII